MKHLKLKASILPTVLAVSILITLIVSSIILIAYYRNLVLTKQFIQDKLILNAESGINYLLAENPSSQTFVSIDLYGEENDSVTLINKPWGLFDVALVEARQGKNVQQKVGMHGVGLDENGRSALYLSDENRPLSISGSTKISGNCFLPKAGIRTAYINQQSYAGGTVLVDGEIFESKLTLPKPNERYLERIKYSGKDIEKRQFQSLKNQKNSFFNGSILFKTASDLRLSETFLSGNIIIESPKAITVEATSDLQDVIINGQKVIIKEGFKGALQIFARDTIVLEKGVKLNFPSSLCTYGNSNKSRIIIGEGSELEGVVFIPPNDAEYLGNMLKISKGAKLSGQFYVDGLVEHLGEINGNLTCRRFFLATPSTLYENHLLDAVLDYKSLSSYFVTSPLLSGSKKRSIVKWLY